MIKFKFWDLIDKRFCNDRYLFVDASGCSYRDTEEEMSVAPHVIAVASTGLTDNDKNDIYYGDVYYVAGRGAKAVIDIYDVAMLIEAKLENDLGDKLGDIYNNPELKDAE